MKIDDVNPFWSVSGHDASKSDLEMRLNQYTKVGGDDASFSQDLIALSNGTSLVLLSIASDSSPRQQRVQALARIVGSDGYEVDSAALSRALVDRGFHE